MGGGATKESKPIQNYSLQTQKVSANKFDQDIKEIDGSIVIVSGKKLQDLHILNTQDLVKILPGFILKTQASMDSVAVSVRGIRNDDAYNPAVGIYVDGIPQDPVFLTQELMDVSRVELLRGPQATIWGQNAQAGILNIVSNAFNSNTPRFYANISGGILSEEARLQVSSPLIKDWLYIGGNFAYSYYNGFISKQGSSKKLNTGYGLSGNIGIALNPKDSGFGALFKYSGQEFDGHFNSFFLSEKEFHKRKIPTDRFIPHAKRNINSYALKLNYDFDKSSLANITSYQDRYFLNHSSPTWNGQEKLKTATNETRLVTQYDNGAYSIIGLYYQGIFWKGFMPPFANDAQTQSLSVFGEGKVPLWSDFELTLGGRYSYDFARYKDDKSDKDRQNHIFNPKLAFGYNLNEDIRLYLSYQTGYKPGGFDFNSGGKINPEHAHNAEIGLHSSLWQNKINLDTSLYYIFVADKQVYSDCIDYCILKNTGSVDSVGLELNVSTFLIDSVQISLGGTFGHSKYISGYDATIKTNLKNKSLAYAPDITINANLDWNFLSLSQANFFINLNANFYSKMYFEEANSTYQEPYTLLDGGIRMEMKNGIYLNLYAQNIFNQTYKNYIEYDRTPATTLFGDPFNIGLTIGYKL